MFVGYYAKPALVVILYIYMYSVNKKRDREGAREQGLTEEEEKEVIELGVLNVTKIDNKGFRYIL